MWLLDNAAWKDTTYDVKGKRIIVPRGTVCASMRHIADEVGVGFQVVRTAIKRFDSESMTNTILTHGKSLITLCNYDKIQYQENPPNTSLTRPQHVLNTQKEQGNKLTRITSSQEEENLDYKKFLEAHPKPVKSTEGKQAFLALIALIEAGENPEIIIAAAKSYAEEIKNYSKVGKVQQSDNFLDAERGKWRDYTPKPKAVAFTARQSLEFKAKQIACGKYVAASSVRPDQAREMLADNLVTTEQL